MIDLRATPIVMAGLGPAIHVFAASLSEKAVDADIPWNDDEDHQ